jgi:hypothetical protein
MLLLIFHCRLDSRFRARMIGAADVALFSSTRFQIRVGVGATVVAGYSLVVHPILDSSPEHWSSNLPLLCRHCDRANAGFFSSPRTDSIASSINSSCCCYSCCCCCYCLLLLLHLIVDLTIYGSMGIYIIHCRVPESMDTDNN